jgi:hypothetical protein
MVTVADLSAFENHLSDYFKSIMKELQNLFFAMGDLDLGV